MPISTINQNGLNAPLTLTAPILGTPASINLANATNLPKAALPTGSVLQVVQATYSADVSISNTTTYTDSGLSASITPSSSSNKILVIISQTVQLERASTSPTMGNVRLVRGSTTIWENTGYGGGIAGLGSFSVTAWKVPGSIVYLDSPATTSSTTYKTQGRPNSAEAGYSITFQTTNGTTPTVSTMILMEIAA